MKSRNEEKKFISMSTFNNNQDRPDPRKILPILFVIVGLILLIIFWNRITITLEPGERGVLFKRFGGGLEKEKVYREGFHFLAPWNRMIIYDVRQQEISETMNVLSSDGLQINTDVSIWYHPQTEEVGFLHDEIGPEYLNKVIIPSLRSAARSVVGRYTPLEIYSTKREGIQGEIFSEIEKLLKDKHVEVDQVLIRSIVLPDRIKAAIEDKLKQEQENQKYEFKLAIAQKEAERQRIEAEGKAAANRILSASLNDLILKEKGIQATLKLSESTNSKIVIMGDSDGLPIILGDK